MANRQKGEVAFQLEGKAYTLRYSIDALCALEQSTGMKISEIGLLSGGAAGITELRALLWAGLRERHAELDLKAAGELIRLDKVAELTKSIVDAFMAAFPELKGVAASGPLQAPAPAEA